MSCRIIGRNIEYVVFDNIVDYINNKEANAETANEKNINNGSGNPIP